MNLSAAVYSAGLGKIVFKGEGYTT